MTASKLASTNGRAWPSARIAGWPRCETLTPMYSEAFRERDFAGPDLEDAAAIRDELARHPATQGPEMLAHLLRPRGLHEPTMEESRESVSHAPQGTGNVERRQTLSGPSRCPPDARGHRPPHGPVPPMARATTDARGGGPALRRPGGPCRLVDQGSRGGLAGARGARRARDHTHQARTTPRALEAGSRLPRRHGTLRGGNRLAETG